MTHPAVIESRLLERSSKLRGWGAALLLVPGLLWIYAMYELYTPWDSHYGKYDCSAPAFGDRGILYTGALTDGDTHDYDTAVACARDRDWPQPVAALAVSLPFAVTGASLLTAGLVTAHLRHLERDLAHARQ